MGSVLLCEEVRCYKTVETAVGSVFAQYLMNENSICT